MSEPMNTVWLIVFTVVVVAYCLVALWTDTRRPR
jgi:cbb3-type cytochrome oxidase subunit 3